MLPEVGGMNPVIMRIVVDLPAPLGPRKPSTSPRSTVNEMSSTARFGPKAFTRFSILIICSDYNAGRDSRTSKGTKTMKALRNGLAFAMSASVLIALPAHAQKYPAQRLGDAPAAQVIVENRPGAGGLLGIEQGVKAKPDGYTFTLIASSYTVNAALYPLKYDPMADITPVVQISQGPMIVIANPKFPAKTMPELIALAKQKPGTINFASAGQGSITHMVSEFFQYRAGIKMNHVPYKGTGPALTDTISGQTDIFFATTATSLP